MRNAAVLLLSLLAGLQATAQSGKIILEGQIQNASLNSISITDFNYREVATAEITPEGSFRMSTKLEMDGYYYLTYGRNTSYVYLYPKDQLTISVDANNFDQTLTFQGKGSERNNYLAQKSLKGKELTEDLETFCVADDNQYLENIQNAEKTHLASLEAYEVENFFELEERKALRYQTLNSIRGYEQNYLFYLGDSITASPEFYRPLDELNLANESDYRKHPYYYYLVNATWNKRIAEASDVEEMLQVFRKVKSQRLAVALVNGFYSKISADNDRAKDYLDLIKRITNHQPFVEAAEKRYKETLNAQGLKKGDPAPVFDYEGLDGESVKLSDLRGKYVYIDVWATWCAPCIKQVPYLKALEESYRDKNVVFVSISVDKEALKPRWRKMIADKELGGLQLFADNSFDSDFMNAFAVNSIPRFILIDPDGNIVDSEAPRPSFQKTRDLLDGLLN